MAQSKSEQKLEIDISSKRTYQWQQLHEMCSVSLIIGEIQMETTRRYHITSVRIATNTIKKVTGAVTNVKKLKHLCTVGGKVKWCIHCGKSYGSSLKS